MPEGFDINLEILQIIWHLQENHFCLQPRAQCFRNSNEKSNVISNQLNFLMKHPFFFTCFQASMRVPEGFTLQLYRVKLTQDQFKYHTFISRRKKAEQKTSQPLPFIRNWRDKWNKQIVYVRVDKFWELDINLDFKIGWTFNNLNLCEFLDSRCHQMLCCPLGKR